MKPEQQWQEIKANYLKLIEKNIAQVDHPQRSEILTNVREHLDSKYAELPPEQKNWETFQQIITEMGPPAEYAELLAEDQNGQIKRSFGINEFLAIVFVIVLAAVGSYLVYTGKSGYQPESNPVIRVNDLPVNGITINQPSCTAEFVQSLLGEPTRIDSDGKMLRYNDHGFDLWFSENKHLSEIHLNQGFTGKLDTGISMLSPKQDVFKIYGKPVHTIRTDSLNRRNDDRILYEKGNISRIYYNSYGLIFWFKDDAISQIVPFRGGMESADSTLEPVKKLFKFESDEQVFGTWVTVDFVQYIFDFDPDQKSWKGELFLKELVFEDNGVLWWTNTDGGPYRHRWTKGILNPDNERSSHYNIERYVEGDYLFIEWISGDVTIRGQEPWYYVLKRTE